MLAACRAALPVEVAICAAAVADWRVAAAAQHKLKKDNGLPPSLELAQNPDILAELSQAGSQRPSLVVGFATERSEEHTSELQSLMRISYAVFCLKKKNETESQQI